MDSTEREKIVRRQVQKLANRLRRQEITECTVEIDPQVPIPYGEQMRPWIGRIRPAPGHVILLSPDFVHVSAPAGRSIVPLARVTSCEWMVSRSGNKLRDGTKLAVGLDDGSEVVVDAPGWAWHEVFHLFWQIVP